MNTEEALATHIAAQAVLAAAPWLLVYGTNCHTGAIRPASKNLTLPGAVPHRCVFTMVTAGRRNFPYHQADSAAPFRPGEDRPGAITWVRGKPGDYDDPRGLADIILATVDRVILAGYFELRAVASRPQYVHRDEADHHVFSIDWELSAQFPEA